ncbi:hypothetical protein M8818_007264 [Zalaria obscura]|uniref:Uncharacterized protein n=1 Tax=Zalaria obscura TaxID=2024903 RepID=A0ACC3S504_9PEZI
MSIQSQSHKTQSHRRSFNTQASMATQIERASYSAQVASEAPQKDLEILRGPNLRRPVPATRGPLSDAEKLLASMKMLPIMRTSDISEVQKNPIRQEVIQQEPTLPGPIHQEPSRQGLIKQEPVRQEIEGLSQQSAASQADVPSSPPELVRTQESPRRIALDETPHDGTNGSNLHAPPPAQEPKVQEPKAQEPTALTFDSATDECRLTRPSFVMRRPTRLYIKYAGKKVPKDQMYLLERRESWVPSLPGHSFPCPNVPIKFLKSLEARFRDEKKSNGTASVVEVSTRDPDEKTTTSGDETDGDSDEELPWDATPSPSRLPQPSGLPPDSSAPMSSHHSLDQNQQEEGEEEEPMDISDTYDSDDSNLAIGLPRQLSTTRATEDIPRTTTTVTGHNSSPRGTNGRFVARQLPESPVQLPEKPALSAASAIPGLGAETLKSAPAENASSPSQRRSEANAKVHPRESSPEVIVASSPYQSKAQANTEVHLDTSMPDVMVASSPNSGKTKANVESHPKRSSPDVMVANSPNGCKTEANVEVHLKKNSPVIVASSPVLEGSSQRSTLEAGPIMEDGVRRSDAARAPSPLLKRPKRKSTQLDWSSQDESSKEDPFMLHHQKRRQFFKRPTINPVADTAEAAAVAGETGSPTAPNISSQSINPPVSEQPTITHQVILDTATRWLEENYQFDSESLLEQKVLWTHYTRDIASERRLGPLPLFKHTSELFQALEPHVVEVQGGETKYYIRGLKRRVAEFGAMNPARERALRESIVQSVEATPPRQVPHASTPRGSDSRRVPDSNPRHPQQGAQRPPRMVPPTGGQARAGNTAHAIQSNGLPSSTPTGPRAGPSRQRPYPSGSTRVSDGQSRPGAHRTGSLAGPSSQSPYPSGFSRVLNAQSRPGAEQAVNRAPMRQSLPPRPDQRSTRRQDTYPATGLPIGWVVRWEVRHHKDTPYYFNTTTGETRRRAPPAGTDGDTLRGYLAASRISANSYRQV